MKSCNPRFSNTNFNKFKKGEVKYIVVHKQLVKTEPILNNIILNKSNEKCNHQGSYINPQLPSF